MIRKSLLLSTLLASALMLQACAGNGESDYRLTKQELAMLHKAPRASHAQVFAKRQGGKTQILAQNNPAKRATGRTVKTQQFAMNKAPAKKPLQPRLVMAMNTPSKAKQKKSAVPPSFNLALREGFMNAQHYKKKSTSVVFASKVKDSELTKVRGAFSPDTFDWAALNAQSQNNTLSGNSVTGANFVTDSAFNGAQGLVNVIQNSGNNVIIQSATIVNLTLQ